MPLKTSVDVVRTPSSRPALFALSDVPVSPFQVPDRGGPGRKDVSSCWSVAVYVRPVPHLLQWVGWAG